MKSEILRMEHISKYNSLSGTLNDFKLNIYKGEVLGIVGLLGAGKTLISNILSGLETIDEGTIYFNEKQVNISSRSISRKLGIFCVHHEMSLVPQLSVADNIFVIKDNSFKKVILNEKAIVNQTKELLHGIGLDILPNAPAESLTIAQQHLVELTKAIAARAKLIVIDNITDSYTLRELEKLKGTINQLQKQGISFLFASRKPEEILEIADRLVILREGKNVKTMYKGEYNLQVILGLLIGKELKEVYKRSKTVTGVEILKTEKLCCAEDIKDLSFKIYRGEILGILDLENKSNIKLSEVLTGISPKSSGDIYVEGKKIEIKNLRWALKHGIAIIPQDSIESSIFLNMNILDNITFPILKKISSRFSLINSRMVKFLGKEFLNKLNIDRSNKKINVETLDVYTLQKILILKWILYNPKVLIYVNPCSKADIVTREIIFSLLDEASKKGISIIIISSDIGEVSSICDRVIVLSQGKLKAEYSGESFDKINLSSLY